MPRYWFRLLALIVIVTLLGTTLPTLVSKAEDPQLSYSFGLVPSPPGDYPTAPQLDSSAPLPAYSDLSQGMPPVGNQGRQSSCVGWAIAYYYRSYQEGLEQGRVPTRSSDIFSPAFIYNQRTTSNCQRDAGMSMYNGLRIAVEQGVATLQTMAYDPSDACTRPSAEALAEAMQYRAESYLNLFSSRGTANLNTLKQYLASGTPVLLAVPVYAEFMAVTAANAVVGVPAQGSAFHGGHAITVVGYDDDARTFKFANSWGHGWGQSGYAYLTYEFVQQTVWEGWILVDRDTTPPDLAEYAIELKGAQNDVAQSEVDNPIFTWDRSRDAMAVYQVYWGCDAEGTAQLTIEQPFFVAPTVMETATQYLRVRAIDAAGNSSSWRTLFVFRYALQSTDQQPLLLQPARVR